MYFSILSSTGSSDNLFFEKFLHETHNFHSREFKLIKNYAIQFILTQYIQLRFCFCLFIKNTRR